MIQWALLVCLSLQVANELFVEMGRVIGPQSTGALMDMLQQGGCGVWEQDQQHMSGLGPSLRSPCWCKGL